MNLFSTGRVCVKIAGRDAGRKCVVVEEVDAHTVLIDGNTRRRKTNVRHLEPLEEVFELPSGASHEEVKKVFAERSWPVWETKAKKVAAKPLQKRKGRKEQETAKEG